ATDLSGPDAVVQHVYSGPYDGRATVRAVDDDGLTNAAWSAVKITPAGPARPASAADVAAAATGPGRVTVSWTQPLPPGTAGADYYLVAEEGASPATVVAGNA